jgi:hypothetical protein
VTAFGVTTAPASVGIPDLAAGLSLAQFTRRWKIVRADSGRWECRRA